jgi:hypothetical protein
MTAAAGRQGGSIRRQGGDCNSDGACCDDDDIDHDDDHPSPVVVDVFVIGCHRLCNARLTTAVGRQRGSGRQQGGEDGGRQGQTQWCHLLRQRRQPSLPRRRQHRHGLAPSSSRQWNDNGCGGTTARGRGQGQWTPWSSTDNWVSPWLSRHPFSQCSPTSSTRVDVQGGKFTTTRPTYMLRLRTYCGLQRR